MKRVGLLAAGILLMIAGSGWAIRDGYYDEDRKILTLGFLALGASIILGTILVHAFLRDRRRR